MAHLLYNLALHCFVAPLLVSYYLPQILIKGKYRHSIRGKLGGLPSELRRKSSRGLRIWFHAVSVGEVVALAPLVEKMISINPDIDPVISTGTETGQQRACEIISFANCFFYMPLDFPFSVKRALNAVKPDLFVMTETEIWPNLINELKRSGVKIALVNGRISDRSYPRYLMFKRFLKQTLDSIDLFSMCSDEDAFRITQMGANPEKTIVSGNIKIDSAFKPPDADVRNSVQKAYDLTASDRVVVAGSIHPGEDTVILESYKELLKKYPELILIMAPRHLDKIKTVVNKVLDSGLEAPLMKSALDVANKRNGNKIIIIDRMGELFNSYSIASAVFVGGSLVPRGGQNILEPASWSKPVLFGPYMEDFRDSSDILLKNKAAFCVKNAEELTEKLDVVLTDSDLAARMGETAHDKLMAHVGSATKTSGLLFRLLGMDINQPEN